MSKSSEISRFLDRRAEELTANVKNYLHRQFIMRHKVSVHESTLDEYHGMVEALDRHAFFASIQLRTLKKMRRAVEQDMEEELNTRGFENIKMPSKDSVIRNAYGKSMAWKASYAPNNRLEEKEYRREVVIYLRANSYSDGASVVLCPIAGPFDEFEVQAVYLVPESLPGDALAFLFGIEEFDLPNPRNGIVLHKILAKGLKAGIFAIIPSLPADEGQPVKWKCLLVDPGVKKTSWFQYWKRIDGMELAFQGSTRPARRYLYFRFVMTYLIAKRKGNYEWVDKIRHREVRWTAKGNYVQKSLLLSVGRSVSGTDLPSALYEGNTFDAREVEPEIELALTVALRAEIKVQCRISELTLMEKVTSQHL
ncbi:uncharacterized protein GIQ15_06551 [Arthroderma uncinatum]|uniref:uncharacterized protein n=1 Tax=Arthroderma uncinatum TaxID=74035 RepID=UPI00144AE8F9|nr:uncharacterized protein GIQ15_06551 [Arthroderma uncinatum]KAF3479575.1 hypothetical protein GIQ15_06551 [Arthroderma uncinatum]